MRHFSAAFIGSFVLGNRGLPSQISKSISRFHSNSLHDNVIVNATGISIGDKDLLSNCSNLIYSKLGVSDNSKIRASFYIPIFLFFKELLDALIPKRPLFIGISALQGCGKTTLTNLIREMFLLINKNCVVMSIDDFYLTGPHQDALASSSNNPLLKYRGNAGTHDVQLMINTLTALSRLKAGEIIRIPVYDKSAREGRGDREREEDWTAVTGPVDIVLLEGWMLGFESLSEKDITEKMIECGFQQINSNLQLYTPLHLLFDAWLVLKVDNIAQVFEWRLQAEREMRERGRNGMTDDQVNDFVHRFIPAYEACLTSLYTYGPARKAKKGIFRTSFHSSNLEPDDTLSGPSIIEKGADSRLERIRDSDKVPVLQVTVNSDRSVSTTKLL